MTSRAPLKPFAGVLALIVVACAAIAAPNAVGAEVMPPKPAGYFNDYANVVSRDTALRLNEQLAQFERETSNQIVVAVFPKMESDSSIEDYTQRIAQQWAVGQGDRRNGAVLFVFVNDRKMFIQVGYGLEGGIPDVTAFDITERRIKPLFRANDFEGGLAVGTDSLMKAARGEYQGTGETVAEKGRGEKKSSTNMPCLAFFLIPLFMLAIGGSRRRRRRGWGYTGMGGPFIGGWSSGGGGWGGGGWSSGGGGGFSGFSGGGGSFGGGGAGSDW